MASVHATIRNALEANLANVVGIPASPSIASANSFEGVEFTPVEGTPWLRVRVYYLTRNPLDVTASGLQRYDGTLNIDVHTSFGYGANAAETLADAIVDAYEAGRNFVNTGVTVHIERAEVNNAPASEPPWVVVPVSIKWKAFYN